MLCVYHTSLPVGPFRFKASENGTYTLAIDADHVELSYLFDDLTGTDADLLAVPSYTFEATPTDGAICFRL